MGKKVKFGLQGKIFLLCVMIVILAGVGFAALGIRQLRGFQRTASESGKEQTAYISSMSQSYMMSLTEENMVELAYETSAAVARDLWILKHDVASLAAQVEEILENPEIYPEIEVNPPRKINGSRLELQFLMPEGYSPTEEEIAMMRKLASLSPMMREMIIDNDFYTNDLIIALPNGLCITMDTLSNKKVDNKGNVTPFDPRERPWWKGAEEIGSWYMTLPSYSELTGLTEIEIGIPVFIEGELVAVVEGSISLKKVTDGLERTNYGSSGFSIVISKNGTIIYSPRKSGELQMDNEFKKNIKDSDNEKFKELYTRTFKHEEGFEELQIDGEDYYVAFGNRITPQWALFMFISKDEVEQPTQFLIDSMNQVTDEYISKYENSFEKSAWIIVIIVLALLVWATITAIYFSKRITDPINHMTDKVRSITGDSFNFDMEKIYRTHDEIEVLAGTFKELSERTNKYINEITNITAEKERISAELNVAAKIQEDMLPQNFPLYPDRHEFDIYATMDPAKEVGGDFYDMFLIDDDHLCITCADVSGKGVPAALFMVISKTMIKNRAHNGGTPSEILFDVNNSLCEGNDEKMFVTVWLGILTISTGELIQASAGHEYPAIKRKDGDFELIKTDNGLVMGYMENMKYKDETFNLEPGDVFFMYTDGLPEATNAEEKMFELYGMINALNKHKDDEPEAFLDDVRKEVDSFVKDAPQFDDLTMLVLRYNGTK